MREIVVLSGKGGTGKTIVTSSFLYIASMANDKIIAVDADVDAPNLHIYTDFKEEKRTDFKGGILAEIIPEKCTGCRKCYDMCSFGAIFPKNNIFEVNPLLCEGCKLCYYVCDDKAINITTPVSGYIVEGKNLYNQIMVKGELIAGKENTGKLVTEIKKRAREIADNNTMLVIDGPPGVGCPVIATLSNATDMIIVAESTPSGFSDVERLMILAENFNIKKYLIINKTGLNADIDDRLRKLANDKGMTILMEIPFDKRIQELSQKKKIPVKEDEGIRDQFVKSWDIIKGG